MASKNVINRQKSTRMVVAAIRESSDRVQTGLTRYFDSSFAESVVVFFAAVAAFLERITSELVAADEKLYRERREDAEARSVRDRAVTQLRGVLITFNEDVRYMYGAEAAAGLGFGTTPTEAEELRRYARSILSRLMGWTPPTPPRVAEFRWKGQEAEEAVREAVDQLEQKLEQVAREQKQTDEHLANRNRYRERHTKAFSLAATLASHVLSLIGDDELAGKVRPSTRRAGNTEAIAAEEEQEESPVRLRRRYRF